MEIKIEYLAQSLSNMKLNAVVVFMPEKTDVEACDLGHLPNPLKKALTQALALKIFSGKIGSSQLLFPVSNAIPLLLAVGLGDVKDIDGEALRRAAGKAGKSIHALKAETIGVVVPSFLKKKLKTKIGTIVTEGLLLGNYRFDTYKSKKEEDELPQEKLTLKFLDPNKSTSSKAVQSGELRAEATNYARTLGNTPANDMTPSLLVESAKQMAETSQLQLSVLEEEEMAALGMNLLLGVSQGSREPAKLIILEYRHPKAQKTLALVGKGITFDSGGLSLKSGKGMEEMKFDMCGAAAVLGAMKVIGQHKPHINVIGVIPATENLLGGNAQRPGDIVKSHSGKTVEIINTDAEGRLILGDALSYTSQTFSPDAIIDLATLTGACIVALGHHVTAAITNDSKLLKSVIKAGNDSGERIWELPGYKDYEEGLKSGNADLQNITNAGAGTITAGLFLKNFIDDIPWVHLDIAGTAWGVKGIDYHPNTNATGVGVRLLVDWVFSFQS
ncbi:leucyl aminopeptidase [Deltaproteobacteria bacterium TL4]